MKDIRYGLLPLLPVLIAAPAGAQAPDPSELAEAAPEQSPPEAEEDETGAWRVLSGVDSVDGSRRVEAWLTAVSGRSSRGEQIVFVARCQSDRTDAYIVWSDYLGDDNPDPYGQWKYVTVRVGDREPERQEWRVSTDDEATFAPDWSGDLLRAMAGAEYFVAQTEPHAESPVTAMFNTRGMAAAIAPVAEACGWSLD